MKVVVKFNEHSEQPYEACYLFQTFFFALFGSMLQWPCVRLAARDVELEYEAIRFTKSKPNHEHGRVHMHWKFYWNRFDSSAITRNPKPCTFCGV